MTIAPDVLYFFPLVNALTMVTKRMLLPRLPTWAWPLANIAFGTGVAVAAHAAGVAAEPAVQSILADLVRDGVLTGGAATIAYETGTRIRRPRAYAARTRSHHSN